MVKGELKMSNFLKLMIVGVIFLAGCGEVTSSIPTPKPPNKTQKSTPQLPPLDIKDIPEQPQEQVIILEQ